MCAPTTAANPACGLLNVGIHETHIQTHNPFPPFYTRDPILTTYAAMYISHQRCKHLTAAFKARASPNILSIICVCEITFSRLGINRVWLCKNLNFEEIESPLSTVKLMVWSVGTNIRACFIIWGKGSVMCRCGCLVLGPGEVV